MADEEEVGQEQAFELEVAVEVDLAEAGVQTQAVEAMTG